MAGVTTGVMPRGDTVTWEAKHLGFTGASPVRSRNSIHRYVSWTCRYRTVPLFHARARIRGNERGTVMTDDFEYRVPYGILGAIGDRLILASYMRRLLQTRNAFIKRLAESDRSGS